MKKGKKLRRISDREYADTASLRLRVSLVLVLAVFVALSVRLIFIVKDNNAEYQQKILAQQSYDSKTLLAKRGEIIDANGTVLAASKEVYNVILDVKQMLNVEENNAKDNDVTNDNIRNATIDALVKYFDVDRDTVKQYINDVPESRYYKVKTGVSYEEVNRFQPIITKPERGKEDESLYNDEVVGIWFEKYYVRYYPQNRLACDVIGFSLSDGVASYGLEEYYNTELMGTSGRQYGYLSDETNFDITTIPAVDGNTLVTTLDANVQGIVEKHLKAFCEEYKDNQRKGLGANNVGCIIMRADSGEILAMASYPNYDLNDPMGVTEWYTGAQLSKMEEEGRMRDAYDSIWKNFCISDTYEPGSVMKPFTVAMGLESGKLKGNETYVCHGSLKVGDFTINCHDTNGEGTLTIKKAIAKSCNVALMQIGKQIGKETFLKYQEIFNLGLKTNIDLAGESRTDSLVFNSKTMNETELATASFGQGFNASMIQMISGYAALVNGGYYYEPHVVSKILSSSGSVIKNIEPRIVKQIISNTTSEKIISYTKEVVADGTGWRAKPAGYEIAGKTGTAETVPRGNGEYVVSFMSHVPADDPEIVCYVVVDRPNVKKQEDAKYATTLTRQILTEVLPYLGIHMTQKVTDAEMQELLELELSIYTNRVAEEEAKGTVDY